MSFTNTYLWRVYCSDLETWTTTVSSTEPTLCPIDDSAIDTSKTTILDSRFENIQTDGYINIESSLADNRAIVIDASDTNGGMDIDAGIGGITIDSTNAISIDGGAESNFTTSNGNLILEATAGLCNIDGGSGLNIGNDASSTPILVGTSSNSKAITIGNTTTSSALTLRAGTGGLTYETAAAGGALSLNPQNASSNITLTGTADAQDLTIAVSGGYDASLVLSSTGTGADAIIIAATNSGGGIDIDSSTGGIRADSTGQIHLASSQAAGGSITLDAGSGGLTFTSGVSGTALNSSGLIGINHWSGGDIHFGTSAVARAIITGNNTTSTQLIFRRGTGGLIKSMPAPISLADSDATLTIAQLLNGVIDMTPTTTRTLTFPTAALAVAGVSNVAVDDALDISFINLSSGQTIVIAMGTDGTLSGYDTVEADRSTTFRLRFTNVTGSSEAYTVYRVAG